MDGGEYNEGEKSEHIWQFNRIIDAVVERTGVATPKAITAYVLSIETYVKCRMRLVRNLLGIRKQMASE